MVKSPYYSAEHETFREQMRRFVKAEIEPGLPVWEAGFAVHDPAVSRRPGARVHMATELTEDGFFKTGDMGEIDGQGRLKITGRVKELFKTSKGKYVAPVPVENRLGNHPDIEAVCVTGVEQPKPFALVMLAEERQAEQASGALDRERLERQFRDLLEQINSTLESHEKLAFIVVVRRAWTMADGFLTPTMKIKRSVIEARYAPNANDWFAGKQPVIWEA